MTTMIAKPAKLLTTAQINNAVVISIDLPAIITCPCAKYCKAGCYATRGRYLTDDKQRNMHFTLKESKSDKFIGHVDNIVKGLKYDNPDKPVFIRIHSSGDFYDIAYLKRWVKIATMNADVIFYGYTKSVAMVKSVKLPDNMIIAYSVGGTQDNLIDFKNDKHAIVVKDKDHIPAGYMCDMENDLLMLTTNKIAFTYHGQRKWENSGFNLVKLE